jgi:hypothetical protein
MQLVANDRAIKRGNEASTEHYVPVHDIKVRDGDGTRTPQPDFYTMDAI